MKQILIITITLITFFSCKSQTFPLLDPPNNFDVDGAYYKDLDNDLTKLVGIWQYTNGNEIFKIILKKKIMDTINQSIKNIIYKEDVLYGEYMYIDETGNEIVNTIESIDSFEDVSQHLIYGNYIKAKNHFPVCNDCSENERRVEVLIEDPQRNYFDYDMEVRHILADVSGNPERIRIKIKMSDTAVYLEGQPSNHRLPLNQGIILDKQ